ncbi:response regulator [Chloroflexota bacterium]
MKTPDGVAKRILVVEDEPAIGQACRRVLIGEGFEVDIALNGSIAQDMVAEKRYDLCLIDIRTPTMNGKDFYRWLKERYPELAGRVIFTTGDVMNGGIQGFLEQAARPFLPKPFTPAELRTVVREAAKEWQRPGYHHEGRGTDASTREKSTGC